MADTVERFSDRVENYIKYRPGYPPQVVEYLRDTHGLSPEHLVADIGCGTGVSSLQFLNNGNRVIGVEPNAAMRSAAIRLNADQGRFTCIAGTSESVPLPDSSIDLVVAAQAFHWFEPEATRAEFRRILKPDGHIVLIWNERQLDTTPFLVEYERLLLRYANDYENVRHDRIDEGKLAAFFGTEFHSATFPNAQIFDLEGLKGRMLSSSYMPSESSPVFTAMIEDLGSLFAKHAESGRIKVFYDTNVYVS
ncbi:MAG: class I SAM-dependent methyltransferase [Pyrinomonadaceae bacterium]|nr:class I SAM-dependent methyltransferase [Pyrinomonadaceae bacterium]